MPQSTSQTAEEATLASLLTNAATKYPNRPALIEPSRTTSYAELDTLGRRFATGLAALGLGQGDRIALWLPNTPAHYALTFAVWRLGATVVGVNTRFRAKEVEDIVGRSGAKALIYWPRRASRILTSRPSSRPSIRRN